METTSVRLNRAFDASANDVFNAWLEPDIARKFLFSAPGGEMVRAEIDARVGGHFIFTDRRNGQDIEHEGTFRGLQQPFLITFTFVVKKVSSLETSVTINIAFKDAKSCELTLTHEGIPIEHEERNLEGWNFMLSNLASVLAGGRT